jgi:hypothetical protein
MALISLLIKKHIACNTFSLSIPVVPPPLYCVVHTTFPSPLKTIDQYLHFSVPSCSATFHQSLNFFKLIYFYIFCLCKLKLLTYIFMKLLCLSLFQIREHRTSNSFDIIFPLLSLCNNCKIPNFIQNNDVLN